MYVSVLLHYKLNKKKRKNSILTDYETDKLLTAPITPDVNDK